MEERISKKAVKRVSALVGGGSVSTLGDIKVAVGQTGMWDKLMLWATKKNKGKTSSKHKERRKTGFHRREGGSA